MQAAGWSNPAPPVLACPRASSRCSHPSRPDTGSNLRPSRSPLTSPGGDGSASSDNLPSSLPLARPEDRHLLEYLQAQEMMRAVEPGAGPADILDTSVRPLTPLSRPGTASRPSTARSQGSAGSRGVDAAAAMASVRDHLNAMEIDKVAQTLRAFLVEEREALKDDVDYLTHCLEQARSPSCRSARLIPLLLLLLTRSFAPFHL